MYRQNRKEALTYVTATICSLQDETAWTCSFPSTKFFSHSVTWTVKVRFCGTSQAEAGVSQINLNQILFDLLQYQRTISELMVFLLVDPNHSWQPPLIFSEHVDVFFTSFYIYLCSLSILHMKFSAMIQGTSWKWVSSEADIL